VSLRIVKPGAYSTVQDLGRPGHASLGVPTGGAADRTSLILANRLVGNPDHAGAIEMTFVGATIVFERPTTVALAGATPAGAEVHTPLRLGAGVTLALGPLTNGARGYLAVAGGIDAPLVLDSRSTLVASALGGHEGRPLRAGDVLAIGNPHGSSPPVINPTAIAALRARTLRRRFRVVPGPHANSLGHGALDALLSAEFTVSNRSDRVGLRLTGPTVVTPASGEMITEPMTPGAIQIPPDGSPIILGPDAPVTGGYPVLATVIAADLPALGQLAPRDPIRFELVSIGDAIAQYRAMHAALDAAIPAAAPRRAEA